MFCSSDSCDSVIVGLSEGPSRRLNMETHSTSCTVLYLYSAECVEGRFAEVRLVTGCMLLRSQNLSKKTQCSGPLRMPQPSC
jgi:hypothetical protein